MLQLTLTNIYRDIFLHLTLNMILLFKDRLWLKTISRPVNYLNKRIKLTAKYA